MCPAKNSTKSGEDSPMSQAQPAWRCTLCGYVHQGENAPEFCPVCGASAAEFEHHDEPSLAAVPASQWRCIDCAYTHDGETPPDFCPICGAGPERFEPLADAGAAEQPETGAARIVIIGAGIAGVSAAESVRNASADSTITLISFEPDNPYYRLNLTRHLAGEIDSAELVIHPDEWYRSRQIDLLAGKRVETISCNAKTVELDDGTSLPYDRLILAMGSHPFVPPISGTDLDGVFTLRTAEDSARIIRHLENGKPCVCIGGGILGLETAGALAQRGGNVTLLESHEWLMPRQLNQAAAQRLEAHMTTLGVKLRKNARTQQILGSDGQVSAVLLADGTQIDCGMVILCTGVRPNTSLARKAGLEVNRGVVVDNHLRTSDPHIFAAGDLAEHNGTVYGIWGPSQFQGTIAGLNALGGDTQFGGVPRSNALKVLGIDLLSIGQFTPEDGSYRVVHDQTESDFQHFVFQDGKMVGAILLGSTEAAAKIKKAIEGKQDFSALLGTSPDCAGILAAL
jgi:nitrite reductase (NADH) large subunit